MTPSKCPGCGTKLTPDMLACPNCPMSFPEDEDDSSGGNPLKQSKYYQFVFPVLFFGAIGAIVWYIGSGLMRLGEENNQLETANFLRGDSAQSSPAPSPSAAPAAEPAAGPKDGTADDGDAGSDDDGGAVSIVHADEPVRPAPRSPSRRRQPPPPEVVREWKLRGTVYDLATLKPLPGVQLTFADEGTNRSIRTRSDASGRYRVIVPPLDGRGYAVTADKKGYSPNYLDPGTEGVQEKDEADRKSLSRDLSSTLSATPFTVQSAGAKPLVTDFYLAPRP
jgi:hypothetical protein